MTKINSIKKSCVFLLRILLEHNFLFYFLKIFYLKLLTKGIVFLIFTSRFCSSFLKSVRSDETMKASSSMTIIITKQMQRDRQHFYYVGSTLYKCYANVLCLLGGTFFNIMSQSIHNTMV